MQVDVVFIIVVLGILLGAALIELVRLLVYVRHLYAELRHGPADARHAGAGHAGVRR